MLESTFSKKNWNNCYRKFHQLCFQFHLKSTAIKMKIIIFALISIAATKTAFSEVEDRKSKMVVKPPFNMQQIGELITSNKEKEMGKKVLFYFWM